MDLENNCITAQIPNAKDKSSIKDNDEDVFGIIDVSSAPQFFACLLIIFGAEIAAGVFGFLNKEQVWR